MGSKQSCPKCPVCSVCTEYKSCTVSDWGEYSTCKCDTNGGFKTRYRTITDAGQKNDCPVLEEKLPCNEECSPCVLADWRNDCGVERCNPNYLAKKVRNIITPGYPCVGPFERTMYDSSICCTIDDFNYDSSSPISLTAMKNFIDGQCRVAMPGNQAGEPVAIVNVGEFFECLFVVYTTVVDKRELYIT